MIPCNNLNQIISQEFEKEGLERIGIELKETFDSKGGMVEFPKSHMIAMEYGEGVLVIAYYQEAIPRTGVNPVVTRMIPWDRIKDIYFDQANVPSRIPFPTSSL